MNETKYSETGLRGLAVLHKNQDQNHLLLSTVLTITWTVVIVVSFYVNLKQDRHNIIRYAKIEAETSINKDVMFRAWNASKGGVYVPVTKENPPNPYLKNFPDRDILVSDSLTLTLINPAYMTRQVHELSEQRMGIKAHITSLNPIRPANKATQWETKALKKFETGEPEFYEEVEIDSKPYLNYMMPLLTEKTCLQCHAIQGYKVGDIRGGIRVSIPLTPYFSIFKKHRNNNILIHLMIWLLGIAGSAFAFNYIRKQNKKINEAGTELFLSKDRLQKMMLHSPLAIGIFNPDGSRFEQNNNFTTLIEKISGKDKPLTNILQNPIVGESLLASYFREAQSGRTITLEELPLKSNSKDSQPLWQKTCIYPLTDDNNTISNIVIIFEDITSRKQAELELEQHRKHLEELVKQRTVALEKSSNELEEKNKELERFNSLFVGREFRIKELRDKIAGLEETINNLSEENNEEPGE